MWRDFLTAAICVSSSKESPKTYKWTSRWASTDRPQFWALTFVNSHWLISYLTDTNYSPGSPDAKCQSFFTHHKAKAARLYPVYETAWYSHECIRL